MTSYHLRGVLLPGDETGELWVTDGRLSTEPVPGAETLVTRGFLLPGLVDAHCHVGIGPKGPVDLDEAARQAMTNRDAGTLLIRDCGSPTDTRSLAGRDDLPEIIRAGRHLARPKRYIPGLGVELDEPDLLAAAVREQTLAGDGWVKLVGDWIERSSGDLAPLWPDDVLVEAIAAAHELGARVTAHVFAQDALPGLIAAGIDCIEHGSGLTDTTIGEMARRGTALVPTLTNLANFPSFAAAAGAKYPRYAEHMTALHAGAQQTIRSAVEAGVPVYAGTDAGGGIEHGSLAAEVSALHGVGLSAAAALGAASWDARRWLGRPGLEHGAPADIVVLDTDPRQDLGALRRPQRIVLRGRVVR